MLVQEITNEKELNIFVAEHAEGQFLQSWEWGEFQKSLDRTIWRLGVYKEISKNGEVHTDLVAVATIIEHTLGIGKSYLYCPYGPLYAQNTDFRQKEEITRYLLTELRSITIHTRNQEEIFARLEPRFAGAEVGNFFINEGFKKAHAMQPQDTWVVNLDETDEWLLQQMHSKTRYNIRLAERKGVSVREATEKKDLDIFWHLLQITTARDNFHSHERRYYEALWKHFHNAGIGDQMHMTIKVLIAEHEGRPIAATMLGFFGGRVTYMHGASNHEFRSVMAPHLLQWHGMRLGKQHGYGLYDFNGIKPTVRKVSKGGKEEQWEGVTRFKKGFGGYEVNYVGAWDWVYESMWYQTYMLARRFLRKSS